MKKIVFLTFLFVLVIISTGCMRVYETYTVNDDGTLTVTMKQAYSKELLDQSGEGDTSNAVVETLEDGKEYYTETDSATAPLEELKKNTNLTLTKDIFFYRVNTNSDEKVSAEKATDDQDLSTAISNSIYVKLTINLTDEIVDTNANLKDETSGKTAAFDTNFISESWYAYTAHGKELLEADNNPPVIDNVEDGAFYSQLPDVTFGDDTVVASATINGHPYSPLFVVDGKNVITATDIKGNTTTVTFYTDKKAPVIKGVKNGKKYSRKATFYVKDNVALSKVTVDGKKQKLTKSKLVKKGKYKNYYKLTVKKKGKHLVVAQDNAGNVIKLKFRIK